MLHISVGPSRRRKSGAMRRQEENVKQVLVLIGALIATMSAFAQPRQPMAMDGEPWMDGLLKAEERGYYTRNELKSVESELGSRKLGEISVAELQPYRERIALAVQKDQYVARLAARSYLMPGYAQFATGDGAGGAAYLAGNIALTAGALVGFYVFLPNDLKFDRLDYLDTSLSGIRNAWQAHSIRDYLPAFGVMMACVVADQGLRYLASRSAVDVARNAVDSGKAKLEPLVGLGVMGIRLSY